MIDVLLVLLIFFMSITTAQIEALDNTIQLPVAADARPRKPDPNQRTVNVRWIKNEDRSVLVYQGKEYVDRDELADVLKAIAVLNPKLEILIRADKQAPAREVNAAMLVIGQATAALSFATHNRD